MKIISDLKENKITICGSSFFLILGILTAFPHPITASRPQ